MEFGVLGPVEVRDGDRIVVLPPRRRHLLALLLTRPNAVVSVDQICDELWGGAPPRTAGKSLQAHVHHVRRELGDNRRIIHRAHGYLLVAATDELDSSRFEELVEQARAALAAGRPDMAVPRLRRALGLWRGAPFDGSDHMPLVAEEVHRLAEMRCTAEEDLIGAEIDLGRHGDVVPQLMALVAQHPLREQLRGKLMVALYRSGRPAEALECYREGRRILADQLGLEPTARLRELEHAILMNDPSLDRPALPAVWLSADRMGTPAQLPAAIKDFTGRAEESASIERFLTGARLAGDSGGAEALPVAAIFGRAGVGKTTLAVEVAHDVSNHFRDGQLYVNLRGTDSRPLDPSHVLARFVRTLGAEGSVIPDGLDERAEHYRNLIADKRILVVLDNARDEYQVRPLIPGSRSCGVLVTSRMRLSGIEGAHLIELDGFDPGQAVDLLTKVAGPEQVAAEPDAAKRLVGLCGYLPLAVRISAARLAARRHWSVGRFADRLSDEQRILDELKAGDLEVRGSFALSYQLLNDDQRRLFRLLGHLPGVAFPGWVAAPLTGVGPEAGERLIESLVEARLVEPAGVGRSGSPRYRFHDLLRIFAKERSATEDRTEAVVRALNGLYRTWLSLAGQADDLLREGQQLVRIARCDGAPSCPGDAATVDRINRDPLDWLEQERAVLTAVTLHACDLGLYDTAWRLAACLARFLRNRGYIDDWRITHEAALQVTRSAGERTGEANTLRSIAQLHLDYDRYDEALKTSWAAAEIFRALGDDSARAHALRQMGVANRMLGRLDDALDSLAEAHSLFAGTGDRPGLACTVADLGGVYKDLHRYEDALHANRKALGLFGQLGDAYNEVSVTACLGMVLGRLGRINEARDHLNRCIALSKSGDNWSGEMFARIYLGELDIDVGNLSEAEEEINSALSLAEEYEDRFGKAICLQCLGGLCDRRGEYYRAGTYLNQANELLESMGVLKPESPM